MAIQLARVGWEDEPSTNTPLDSNHLKAMENNTEAAINALFQAIYPVGCIYMTTTSLNPSETFGFGTWEAWGAGRVPVGIDTTDTDFNIVEKTGGEKEHTLTINEMPRHNHNFLDNNSNSYPSIATFVSGGGYEPSQTGGSRKYENIYTNYTGGGQPHNIVQPYITCYMWKRTA